MHSSLAVTSIGCVPNGSRTRLDRVFARLDREPERPELLDAPEMSRHRLVLFASTLAFYIAIVWAVVITSWLVRLDWQVMFFRPYQQWPQIHAFVDYYVVLGQRGPAAVTGGRRHPSGPRAGTRCWAARRAAGPRPPGPAAG
ncbi:hypothetical protein STENM223S_02720 [Streptomyces tendae]